MPASSSLPSPKPMSLRSRLFGPVLFVARFEPTGGLTRSLTRRALSRPQTRAGTLKRLATHAQRSRALTEASALWRAYLLHPKTHSNTRKTAETLTQIAEVEVALNRRAGSPDRQADLWAFATQHLTPPAHGVLHRALITAASAPPAEDSWEGLMRVLDPLRARDPHDQSLYTTAFDLVRAKALDARPDAPAVMAQWWDYAATHGPRITEQSGDYIGVRVRHLARTAQEAGHLDQAEALLTPLLRTFPHDGLSFSQMARLREEQGNWVAAAEHWQLSAAASQQVTTANGAIVATDPKEAARRTRYAIKQLRTARMNVARDLHAAGHMRAYTELVARAVESLPEHRIMKKDPTIVAGIATYVQHALDADGVARPDWSTRTGTQPKRIAFCLDVLKVSQHYTHAKIIFAIAQNIMALDPEIETHLIVTNERLTVSTPTLSPAFNLTRPEIITEMAQAAMGELFGTRFHVHFHRNFGLEGLVETCKSITALDLDLILYGGGHIGLLSNESRVVRHCLYRDIPSAFFFIQANNKVDETLDMIIARGPHAVEGTPGEAAVRIQPYPTLTGDTALEIPEIDPAKARGGVLLSAVAGVRLDLRLKAQSDADLTALFSILDTNPGTVWHFVGCEDPKALARAMPLLKARIKSGQVKLHKLMPFDAFVEMAEGAAMFVQLPGFTGGAGGAGIARRAGVPILTFEHSDVSGRQPAETVFPESDVAGFVDKANALLGDHGEWARVAMAQIEHSQYLRETAPQGFYDCLTEGYALGRARILRDAARAL